MNADEILKKSPDNGCGKLAMYSTRCTWWTSFPEDLGSTLNFGGYPNGMIIHNRDGSKYEIKDSPGLPCCPHCGSVLMQAPLEKFMESALLHSSHYGNGGFGRFIAAHSRNTKTCKKDWK